jgi:hypothetical protein
MLQRLHRSFVLSVCALVSAAAVAMSLWSPQSDQVRTADQNGDGRPDIWRTYDRHGQLLTIALDTNFDGRSDVQEYYQHGVLVRRELDRDFNDRVDLVQDFDPATHKQVRAEVDVDSDGTADLLVLFHGGQPVLSTYGHPRAASAMPTVFSPLEEKSSRRSATDRLIPLQDPFLTDLSLRATHFHRLDEGDSGGLLPCGGLPGSPCDVAGALISSTIADSPSSATLSAPAVLHSPRGPPSSSSLA